jgi:predicted GIY-YIG superfamily endonuclease
MNTTKKTKKNATAWALYVLKCRDNTLYTGITTDLPRRIAQHNDGTASRYTRSRLPVKLVHQERCRGRSSALKKEYAMKQLSRKEKEKYIRRKATALASRSFDRTSASSVEALMMVSKVEP